MNPSIQFKTTIPNNLIRQLSLLRAFLLIASVLSCFALSPTARGVLPAPDGGYPGANTAEGDNALFSLTSGFGNTANGADALFGNSSGSRNTAVGTEALFSNSAGGDNTATGVSALHNVGGGGNPNNGSFNTAIGSQALSSNTTGFDNTANGHGALFDNNANDNTAVGLTRYSATTLPLELPKEKDLSTRLLVPKRSFTTVVVTTPPLGLAPFSTTALPLCKVQR